MLHYTLYPRSTGTGASVPLDEAPATIAPRVSATIPSITRLRFSDIVAYPSTRLGDNDYLVVQARIFGFDVATAAFTPVNALQVTSAGGIRVGVALLNTPVASLQFQAPAQVEVELDTPQQLNSNPFESHAWVDIPAPPLGGGSPQPDVGTFLVQYRPPSGTDLTSEFRVHIDPHSEWSAGHAEEFNLELVVENRLTSELRVVFTVAQTTRLSTDPDPAVDNTPRPEQLQPWFHVRPELPLGLVSLAVVSTTVQVINFGTGPMTLDGSFPAGSSFATTAAGSIGIGGSLGPSRVETLGISFTRPSGVGAGATSGVLALSGDPLALPSSEAAPLHNRDLTVQARFGAVEIMLVLDGSGSMSWDAAGNFVPVGPRRWDRLREAALAFLGIVLDNTDVSDSDGVNVLTQTGVVVFPRISPASGSPTAELLVPLGALNETFITNLQTTLASLNPGGGTPMGEGLTLAVAQFSGTVANQQTLVLMSDGASNGAVNPAGVPLGALDDTIAVMYGDPTSNTTNRTILNDVVGAQDVVEGFLPDAQIPEQLNKAFSKIAADISGLVGTNDPLGTVTARNPVSVHDFTITELDRTFTLWLGWNAFDARRISVELISPRCELIRPKTHSGVRFRAGQSHQTYHVSEAFLNGDGTESHRFGTWKLVVRLNVEGGGDINVGPRVRAATNFDIEKYEYNIWSKSRLGLNVDTGFGEGRLSTGDALHARASIDVDGVPVRSAQPLVEIDLPTGSLSRFLASSFVSPDVLETVRKELDAQGVNDFWAIKTAALAREGKVFNPSRNTLSFPLVEQQAGRYELIEPVIARVPGTYTLRVIARGDLRAGAAFRREVERTLSVEAQLDPSNTSIDVRHDLKKRTALLIVRPRDAFGTPILFDPRLAHPFELVVRNAKLGGALEVQLDGSYTQSIELSKYTPVVDLVVRGKVALSRPVPVPFELVWADVLEKFVPGNNRKANTHADPKVVLGPLEDKGNFLSLGAGGSVIVGVNQCRALPAEVTVFVQPDSDLRAYKIEVRDSGFGFSKHGRGWIEIGRSEGVTETFALCKEGGAQPRLRITDLSARSVARPGQPLSSPGVSIAAVGFGGRSHARA